MRPRSALSRAALIAALALVALPSLAGSRTPGPDPVLDAAAFQQISPFRADAAPSIGPLDPARRSAGFVDADDAFIEPAIEALVPARPELAQPEAPAGTERKPPRYRLTGEATFYDHGTTAMRLPRGTRVVICGDGGCIERVVNDYGPQKPSRIVDLYRPDFFAICGCEWYAGITRVTVYVY